MWAQEGGPGARFFPSLEIARAQGINTDSWVPYIIDHGGGDNQQSYPRPWTEGITTQRGVTTPLAEGTIPDVNVIFVDIESTGE